MLLVLLSDVFFVIIFSMSSNNQHMMVSEMLPMNSPEFSRHLLPRLFSGLADFTTNAVALEQIKETPSYGVVVTVCPAAHAVFEIKLL